MPLPELGFPNPMVISEEGKLGEYGYRALIIAGDEASRTSVHEQVPAQVWDEDDGYSDVLPLWRFLKFGQWEIAEKLREWKEPHAHPQTR